MLEQETSKTCINYHKITLCPVAPFYTVIYRLNQIVIVLSRKGKAGGKERVTRSQLPNLPVFDTSPNNTEQLFSGNASQHNMDLQKEMAFRGIQTQVRRSDADPAGQIQKSNVSRNQLPNLSIFERTLTNSTASNTEQQPVDINKEMESHGIKLHTRAHIQNQMWGHLIQQNQGKSFMAPSTGVSSMSPEVQPRINIQDVLNIRNFEQKRIKLEALVISTTTDLKQIEENLQLVIMHEPNFLDNELYKELIKKKERLLRDLQIFESYRKMFEEEEKVRRLIQQSQDDVVFHKSIRPPPGDSFIPPTTRSLLRSKSGNEKLNSLAPSMLGLTVDPSFFEVPHSMPNVRPQQIYEASSWHIGTNVLGVNAEYKGACPKCGKITNYYNDVCHHCKEEIPLNVKQEVLPSLSQMTPAKFNVGLEKMSPSPALQQLQAVPSTTVSGVGARPKTKKDMSPVHTPEKQPTREPVLEIQKT